jgi:putative heme-binding domain-containing protein
MKRLLLLPLLAVSCLAQNEQDIASGKALFRSNCAFCHGLTALGGRGPSLISPRIIQGASDAEIQGIIRNGIPGTTMPAFESLDKADIAQLVHYIRNLAGSDVKPKTITGDTAHGAQVYTANGCAGCHRVGDQGSSYGPELTRIGAARSSDYIRESILNPSADIPPEYSGVSVVTRDGKKITGVRINEDTFSVQLRRQNEQFALFKKDELQSVADESKSLMPAYTRLPPKDLQDLLAYLETLRGGVKAGTDANKAKGIH